MENLKIYYDKDGSLAAHFEFTFFPLALDAGLHGG